jgi:hypothetical protein
VNVLPTATPSPATLQIFSGLTSARLVNVTVVWAERSPGEIVTWAVPAVVSRPRRRSGGAVRTSATENPSTANSVTVTGPVGSDRAGEQAPTGTETDRPATVNWKVPLTAGLSACLLISRKPVASPWAMTTAGAASRTSTKATAPASDSALLLRSQLKAPALMVRTAPEAGFRPPVLPYAANTCPAHLAMQAPSGGKKPSIGALHLSRMSPGICPNSRTEVAHGHVRVAPVACQPPYDWRTPAAPARRRDRPSLLLVAGCARR